jgi:hypothetical protein
MWFCLSLRSGERFSCENADAQQAGCCASARRRL